MVKIQFEHIVESELKKLENTINDSGAGIEMGRNPNWIREQINITKLEIFKKTNKILKTKQNKKSN